MRRTEAGAEVPTSNNRTNRPYADLRPVARQARSMKVPEPARTNGI